MGTLLEHLHRTGSCRRSHLTSITGLSRSTVGTLVGGLTSRGLVEERRGENLGGRGRPSSEVILRPERAIAIAVDIEVESISVATYGAGGTLLALERVSQPAESREPRSIVDTIVPIVDRQRSALGHDQHFLGVGVAIAGIVRGADGFVHGAPNLGWHDVPLGEMIASSLQDPAPSVKVGNEADLGALAEWYRGAGRGHANVVYLSSEVGVGGGIIVHGHPLAGASGYAGEVGHLPVNPSGAECRCGSLGCWETEIGRQALVRHAMECGFSAESADDVLSGARAGDSAATAAVRRAAWWTGRGLAGVVNIFDPDRIVVGGLLSELIVLAGEQVHETLVEHSIHPMAERIAVVSGSLGDQAQLIGAAEVVMSGLLDDPTIVPELDAFGGRTAERVAR